MADVVYSSRRKGHGRFAQTVPSQKASLDDAQGELLVRLKSYNMISLKGSLSFCSYPPIPRAIARRRPGNAAHVRLLARVLTLAVTMLEIASPAVSVRNDRSIDQSRKSHRQCSRQASRLPQSPERPDETRFDHPLLNRRGDSDCKVKDPENRLENRDSQIGPRVQGADEPKAYFRRSEQDADEHEGYADNPSSVSKIGSAGLD